MPKIEKDDEFYDYSHYERINSIKLGESLDQPPACFSDEAKTAWREDVEGYLKMLSGKLAVYHHEYEGPYDIVMDYEYDRKEKEPYLVLQLLSLSEDGGPQSFRINVRRIKRSVVKDREVLIAKHDARSGFNSASVIQNLDELKRGYHAIAASNLLDEIKKADLDCMYLDFCKNFFSLLRVVLPVDDKTTLQLARIYSRKP